MPDEVKEKSIAEIVSEYYNEHPEELVNASKGNKRKEAKLSELPIVPAVAAHEHKRVRVTLTLDVVVCGECGKFLGVLLPNEIQKG